VPETTTTEEPEIEPILPSEELTPDDELDIAVMQGDEPPPATPEIDTIDMPTEPEDLPLDTMPGPDDEPAEPAPKKRKKIKRGKAKKETVERQILSRAQTLSEWCDEFEEKWGWQRPGVTVTLERLSPIHLHGHTVGGLLQTWKSRRFEVAEVMEKWGGGSFEVRINMDRRGAPPIRLKKRFDIGMAPKLSAEALPESLGGVGGGTAAPQTTHPAVEKAYIDQMGKDTDRWAKVAMGGGFGGGAKDGATAEVYDRTYGVAREATEQRAVAREQMADQRVNESNSRISALEERLFEEQKERDRRVNEANKHAADSAKSANEFLGTLIPVLTGSNNEQVRALSDSAQKQVSDIMRRAEENEKRLHDFYRQEASAAKSLHEMEVKRLETMTEGQLQLLRVEVQTLRASLEAERAENNKLRDNMMQLHVSRAETLQQQNDPLELMNKYAQVKEYAGEFFGGAGGGAEGELGDDAPDWMKLMNNLGTSFGPAIGQILEARGGGAAAAAAPNPPQLTQQQFLQLQQENPAAAQAYAQQHAQQQQQLPPQPPPAPPPPQAGSPEAVGQAEATFDRTELAQGVELLTNLRAAGTTPENAADAARTHLDNGMLRELARRTPSKVIEALESAAIIEGDMATEAGKEYITAFLTALRAGPSSG